MKKNAIYILMAAAFFGLVACKKDNFDEPKSKFSGRLVYQGTPLGFEYNQVTYQLFQFGFGLVAPITSSFAQDGSFNALLFDGEYKMIIPNGQGPFLWPKTAAGAADTLVINLKGSETRDIEVTPYYMITNDNVTASGSSVSASFGLNKIITDPALARNIENVGLYINKTQFVSAAGDHKIAQQEIGGGAITDMNAISLQVNVPAMTPAQNYVFARIGVKISGVEDRLYSQVVKLNL